MRPAWKQFKGYADKGAIVIPDNRLTANDHPDDEFLGQPVAVQVGADGTYMVGNRNFDAGVTWQTIDGVPTRTQSTENTLSIGTTYAPLFSDQIVLEPGDWLVQATIAISASPPATFDFEFRLAGSTISNTNRIFSSPTGSTDNDVVDLSAAITVSTRGILEVYASASATLELAGRALIAIPVS